MIRWPIVIPLVMLAIAISFGFGLLLNQFLESLLVVLLFEIPFGFSIGFFLMVFTRRLWQKY